MTSPLTLYNSLTRSLEPFTGPRDGETVRVYTCGPTVYNYQHIGNMRAFLFADTLGRALRWFDYKTKHVINITDVGHLTSDADAGDDKMERAAAEQSKSIWEVAQHYADAFLRDVARLNITSPTDWPRATDYVEQMIDFAKSIEKDCYQLESGLYFDTARVPDYGSLARAVSDVGESRIDPVSGKRNPQDFAIWRTSAPGENRQMEWDSPWGRGAPGWHIECSVMSRELLKHPFDIHTGGIDHREIHHPNEIAQNQAHCGCSDTGAAWWMHNNFLVDRRGKMSKSTGEFLTLQALVDRGYHPLAYRLMCLQAHYRSEMEFAWEGLAAASVRLKRLVQSVDTMRDSAKRDERIELWPPLSTALGTFAEALAEDLNTARALVSLDFVVGLNLKRSSPASILHVVYRMDEALGLGLTTITRSDLRIRPIASTMDVSAIEGRLAERKEARLAKDFARSDAIRDELATAGVEVMDGDPLGWDWKLTV